MHTRTGWFGSALAALLLTIAGCSGEDQPATTPTPTPTPTTVCPHPDSASDIPDVSTRFTVDPVTLLCALEGPEPRSGDGYRYQFVPARVYVSTDSRSEPTTVRWSIAWSVVFDEPELDEESLATIAVFPTPVESQAALENWRRDVRCEDMTPLFDVGADGRSGFLDVGPDGRSFVCGLDEPAAHAAFTVDEVLVQFHVSAGTDGPTRAVADELRGSLRALAEALLEDLTSQM